MKVRHFLSLSNLGPEPLSWLIKQSIAIAGGRERRARPLHGKIAGIYFRGSSTRTRTAFSVGALRLGGRTIQYGPNDLQVVTGENISDTGRVLSGYLDVLVIRTNDSIEEMEALASQGQMSVINAMSKNEHPTQAIADLVTIREALGRLDDVHVMYIGEGNNSASALAFAVAQTPGMRLTIVTPEKYGVPIDVLDRARSIAKTCGADIQQIHEANRLPKGVDAVYTTRWCTMGVGKTEPNWLKEFEPYQVNSELMAEVSKPSGTIFLHDLPAMRGQEVTDDVLDGPQSLAFRQAEHKLTSAMAILSWCAGAM